MNISHPNHGLVVASTSLARIFGGEPIKASDGSLISGDLHLPEYQRPYCWGKPQMSRLLADLKSHFKRSSQQLKHDFYLGTIILHQDKNSKHLNIIDGQQRLTSMALLCHLAKVKPTPRLKFHAPESQSRIRRNLAAFAGEREHFFDLQSINITLVVTRSQDDAYRFFETQNTGGVRLSGPDIIKAHHLRAIEAEKQNQYALDWERMGKLDPLIDATMKARHWHSLAWRDLSSQREPAKVRQEIVYELAEATNSTGQDLAYRQLCFPANSPRQIGHPGEGYAMRQPLDAGVNAIHYLRYFHTLRQSLLVQSNAPFQQHFYDFYHSLVRNADSSPFLKQFYDCTLLLYVSHFGHGHLLEAALWLFRVVFSPRVSNKKTVRESTVQAFAREHPVLDWVASSYTHQQLLGYLQGFSYTVDPNNLDTAGSVKRRFVDAVCATLNLELDVNDASQIKELFDSQLQSAITQMVSSAARIKKHP